VARIDVVFILLDEKGEVSISREKMMKQGSFVARKSLSISLLQRERFGNGQWSFVARIIEEN